MFSGIIQRVAIIRAVEKKNTSRFVRIATPGGWKLRLGESVAVQGICSTVQARNARYFEVEYMQETLSKTTAGGWQKGDLVHLERSLRHGERISGHFVQGHIDARGEVTEVRRRGSSREITVRIPRRVVRFVAPCGSIAIDGVSLTVASLRGLLSTVALVSYTQKHTTLGQRRVGSFVNIEIDLIARYMARLMRK